MRKAAFVGIAILAALALSVGAFAYPMVAGVHSLTTPHQTAPASGTHPQGDENSTGNGTCDHPNGTYDDGNETHDHENEAYGNETGDHGNETGNETGDHEGYEPPEANETENETGNGSRMDAAVQTLALTPSVVTGWMIGAHNGVDVLTMVRNFATVEWSLVTAAWGHLFG
jgi:hypothetical protein